MRTDRHLLGTVAKVGQRDYVSVNLKHMITRLVPDPIAFKFVKNHVEFWEASHAELDKTNPL